MIKGVDVSTYQGLIDFNQLANAVDFVYMRVGEGDWLADSRFQDNRGASRKTNLIRGYYHLVRPDLGNSPVDSANAFLSFIDDLQPDEFLVLDYEVSTAPYNWKGNPVPWCLEYLKAIESKLNGYKPLIYMNTATMNRFNWQPVIDNNNGIIVALYDNNPDAIPSSPWSVVAMKQYTDSGRIAGIAGDVDLDVFYGDRETLKKYGYHPQNNNSYEDPTMIAELQKQVEDLKTSTTQKDQQIADLVVKYNTLNKNNDALTGQYTNLKGDYNKLYANFGVFQTSICYKLFLFLNPNQK